MRSRLTHAALFILCTTVSLISYSAAPIIAKDDFRETVAEICEAEAKYDLFSGSVLVAKNGETIYAKGFGYANKEYLIPNSLDTQFNISSIQKSFIATVIMQLFQEGRIDLDDPLTKYFPDCPYKTADQIRIRHLLNHTSGLGEYRDTEEYRAKSESFTCIDDVLPLVYLKEPTMPPGEGFRYSNAGVLFLKAIIEKVEGVKLKEVLERRIFLPLGMENTALFYSGQLLPHRATAYMLADDGETYLRILSEPSAYAGGGIYTTTLDLLKFDQALYTEKLLNAKNKKIMFTPVEASPRYAYGWIVVPFGGTTVVYHSGASGGFNSEFRRYPEIGYTIVVLSNYADAAFELANKIDCMLLGMPYAIATEADLFYRRGMQFQRHDNYRKAVELFEKNIKKNSEHLPSLYQSARSRIMGEFDQEKAIELLDMYIELADETTQPSIAAAWWRKGVANEQLGMLKKAVQCHKKSLELDPDFEYAVEALKRLEEEAH
jgi:CubicO group peptidase (beta-lactamase class C family)